jgi:hypothetical protein
MSREQLHELVDALPAAALVFLSALGEEEVIDAETAARLDAALAEPGENIPLEALRRPRGL